MRVEKALIRSGMLLGICLLGVVAPAQVIIIEPPRPPHWPPPHWPPPPREIPVVQPAELRELTVDAQVRGQVAEVRLGQTFHNPNSTPLEAQYLFPVPEGGTIQDFVLMVDGKEVPGELMDKDAARRIYEDIVRRRRDPALLEWIGRGLLKTSVFPIPGNGERTVTLRYTALLPKESDRLDLRLPLGAPGHQERPVGRLAVEVRLESREPIKSLYCPTHTVTIDRDGDRRARVRLEARDVTPAPELRLVVGLAGGPVGATLLSTRPTAGEDGFFLLLVAPEIQAEKRKPLAKTIVLVLDRSGSMSGKKIEQAQKALRFVLDNLREGDTFNVIAYDDRVETFRPELQRFDPATREAALRFVDNIRAGGSTNIDAALRTALEMLPKDAARPAYVLFLTDGLPTVGEQNEVAIAEHARAANQAKARLFAFGVGYDLNARLLDRLSGGNGGATEFVRPDEDIEAAVGRCYGKMSSPVLSSLRLELDGKDVNRVYPRDLPDLFQGGQFLVAGRYRQSGKTTIRLHGRVGEREQAFAFPAELAETGRGADNAFVERLWATRRIADLIDQIDLKGKNQELVDELVALSKRYGILTPYTSFLAREETELAQGGALARQADERLRMLDAASGAAGVELRAMKSNMARALAAPAPAEYAMTPAVQGTPAPGGGETIAATSGETIRQVGAKTFYRRQGGWIDAEALDRSGVEPIRIVAYSDDWFALARRLGPTAAGWLAFAEPVTLAAEGKVYRIEQPVQ